MADEPRIAIAGAGIAGLTAALALARAGFTVSLIEQSAVLEEVGAGIQLTPNASRVLIGLGLRPALDPVVVTPAGMDVRAGASGAVLAAGPLGPEIEAAYGAPWWVVHRADLQAVLLSACRNEPAITLETGLRLVSANPLETGVSLTLERSFPGTGESPPSGSGPAPEHEKRLVSALVGADGLWSATRRALGDKNVPHNRSRTAWRATVPVEAVPSGIPRDRVGLWLGAGAHLVHYPVKAGRLVNLVAVLSDPSSGESWSGPGDKMVLVRRFRNWAEPARALIAAADGFLTWPLGDRDTWFGPGEGAVTLMGDAAHPMLPFLAQGGAMAIEDAAVLAREVQAMPGDLPAAFRRYEAARRDRVAAVQRGARTNGRIYHLDGPLGFARDTAIRLMGGKHLVSSYDWIYRHKA
jgi:salicylate hydroxylase